VFAERLSDHAFSAPRLAFKRLWRPSIARPNIATQVCDQHPEECSVDALRAALARETTLLHEKEVLLQEQEVLRAESDHRLLNGLQMVVSLLSLQSRAANTPEVAKQLSVAANRVATIERVHRRLHFHDGTKTVGMKKYLQELCQDSSGLTNSSGAPRLDILVEGCEIDIPSATAISLGFIANELITNAVKHGRGRIIVGLDADPDKSYTLSVCNDGPALPDGFDPDLCQGLGMKLIRSLVRKIGGEISFGQGADNQGARFVVLFS
jgi:two-component sensor histidine kinase